MKQIPLIHYGPKQDPLTGHVLYTWDAINHSRQNNNHIVLYWHAIGDWRYGIWCPMLDNGRSYHLIGGAFQHLRECDLHV